MALELAGVERRRASDFETPRDSHSLSTAIQSRASLVDGPALAAEMSQTAKTSPSYDVIPDLGILDNADAVRRAIAGKGYDAILTIGDYEAHQAQYAFVRLLGSEGTFTRMGGYIESYDSGFLVLDVGLWDADTLEPVWQATTDSYDTDLGPEGVQCVAHFMIETLRQRGYIK